MNFTPKSDKAFRIRRSPPIANGPVEDDQDRMDEVTEDVALNDGEVDLVDEVTLYLDRQIAAAKENLKVVRDLLITFRGNEEVIKGTIQELQKSKSAYKRAVNGKKLLQGLA
jgi:hypothetical protein